MQKKINGIDVSSRTHADCVKIIKKTGDTLALKVYTASDRSGFDFLASNLISSNLSSIYQTPSSLMNKTLSSLSASQSNISASYYAASTIPSSQTADELNKKAYTDGTKSLPHKKKRKK